MSHRRLFPSLVEVTLSGTGTEVQYHEILKVGEIAGALGRVRYISMRQKTGGGATACRLYIVHNDGDPSDPSSLPREKLVAATSSITDMTPSDTDAFFETPFSAEPSYYKSLAIAIDVTAGSGAWEIVLTVELER